MRAVITATHVGSVHVEYDDPIDDRRIVRAFTCPANGGYVREITADGRDPQVCERLGASGSTLIAPSRDQLIDVIRREYRALQRRLKRDGWI